MFGRGKIFKCVDLITKVQDRIHLLKNNRRSIGKQSREDVAKLLKDADYRPAFDKTEQIYKDERMVEIYDLLYDYCEVVMRNFTYICKHKNCPDDLKEAISTLIYVSERFEELPELRSIGRLLGDRYGDKFVFTALQLRPGNHVKFSTQIKEVLNMKDVHDYVKYKVLKEIESSYIEQGPICLQEEKVFESSTCQISSCDEEAVQVDVSGESLKFSESPVKNSKILKLMEHCRAYDDIIDELVTSAIQSPKEVIYLDDIKKIASPVSKHGIQKEESYNRSYNEERIPSRNSLKMRRAGRKSCQGRMESQDNTTDFESTINYGYLASPETERKSTNGRVQRAKSGAEKSCNSTKDILKKCDNERRKSVDTRYNPTKDILKKRDNERRKSVDTRYNQTKDNLKKRDNERRKSIDTHYNSTKDILKKRDNERRKSVDTHYNSSKDILKKHDNERRKSVDTHYNSSKDILKKHDNERRKSVNTLVTCARAMSLQIERVNQSLVADNISRSKLLSLECPHNQYPHPKLPDCDEIEAKFMELKRDKMQTMACTTYVETIYQ